jgi:hypothetical protein
LLIANGLHLKLTTKILAIICSIQIFVLSTSVISPDLHFLVFHSQYSDHSSNSVKTCSGHHHGNTSENEDLPDDEQNCPVIMLSKGLTAFEVSVPEYWGYVDYRLVQFIEPESFSSEYCKRLFLKRAPPLV